MNDNQQSGMERRNSSILQSVKRAIVGILGRQRANRVAGPYHDWRAHGRTAKTLAGLPARDLCVNIGCGPKSLPGWINLDAARGESIEVVWDLTRGLPFGAETCSAIFGEHVIEHLSKADGEQLVRECYRALQRGGVLRLSTPDAGRFIRSYIGDGSFLRDPRFAQVAETSMDRVNMMMREHGQHLWVYDAESLTLLLRKAGFSSATETRFEVSAHPRMLGIDSPERAFESLYVEAIK
jgi:predicted SAM-dependent methyltransferase